MSRLAMDCLSELGFACSMTDWQDRRTWGPALVDVGAAYGHQGQVYEVTGPRLLTFADGVQSALGRAPRNLADCARDAAETGAWTAVAGEGG